MQQNSAAFNHMLTFAKQNNLDPQAALLGNLAPTKHVQAVEVNKLQQEHIDETYITKYTKNNVRHAAAFNHTLTTTAIDAVSFMSPLLAVTASGTSVEQM